MSSVAGHDVQATEELSGCSQPGCRVPPPMATLRDAEGRRWCSSHAPDQRPKQSATSEGGASTRRKLRKVMAPETPSPDWSTARPFGSGPRTAAAEESG